MFKYTSLLFILVVIVTGCINRQLGYFEVSPYARVSTNKIDQPLMVKYSSRINDTYLFDQPGFKFLVTDLHKSYLFAAKHAFGDLFSEVKPFVPGEVGFILEVQQMEPRWTFHERQTVNEFKDTFEYTDIWCHLRYASTIYRNDLFVSQSTGEVIVKPSEVDSHKPEAYFKEAVKRSVAAMAQEHYNKR